MSDRSLVLMDTGGTHVRLRCVGEDGAVVVEVEEVGVGNGDFASLLGASEALALRALPSGSPGPGAQLVLTSRAVPWPAAEQRAALASEAVGRLAALLGAGSVTLVPDGVATYIGCLGGAPGVVVTVGTGTIAVVVGWSGEVRRLDGWGPELGDAGSGYRVGLLGLRAACLELDCRRGGSQALRDEAERAFGALEELPQTLMAGGRLRDVARFAERVLVAARSGDVVAAEILASAAREVADLVADAAETLGSNPGFPVVVTGGLVAGSPELADLLGARCREGCGRTPTVVGGKPGLDGCQRIAQSGVPKPFEAHVARSELGPGRPHLRALVTPT